MSFLNKIPKPIIITSIFILAFALRAYNIKDRGIWIDEKISLLIAHGMSSADSKQETIIFTQADFTKENSIENVRLATINDNGNAFLFNSIEHYWMKLLGSSFENARSLSLLFSMASLLTVFLFCLRNINYTVAMVALLLMAVNPLSVSYAQENRTYSLTIFLSLCASHMFYELFVKDTARVEKRNLKIVLYALFSALSLLSHYLSGYILLSHALIALLLLRDKKKWAQLVVAGTVTLLIFSLWFFNGGSDGLKIMQYQNASYSKIAEGYENGDNPFLMPANTKNIITGWFQVILQEFGNGLQAFFQVRIIAGLLILPLGLIIFSLLKNKMQSKMHVFAICILLTQLLFATALALQSGHTTSFQPLYANFSNPFGTILLATAIVFLSHKHMKIALVCTTAIICIALFSVSAIYLDIANSKEKNTYPDIAGMIQEKYQKGDTLVCNTELDAKLISLYLDNNNYLYKIDKKQGNKVVLKNTAQVFEYLLPLKK